MPLKRSLNKSLGSKQKTSLYLSTSIVATVAAMPPFGIEPLGFLALAGLIKVSIEAESKKWALAYGLIYGIISSLAINSWILNLSILGWLAGTWIAVFPALFSYLINSSELKSWSPIWWASTWVIIEEVRTKLIPFGFNPLSSTTASLPLLQNAAWGSQHIVSFALCLTSATIALWITKANVSNKIIASAINIIVLSLFFSFGNYRILKAQNLDPIEIEKIPMTIMSSQIPFTKDIGQRWKNLEKRIQATKSVNSPYLNIWSESLGFALLTHQPAWDEIKELTETLKGPLLVTPSFPIGNKIYNTSLLIEDKGTEAQLYKKRFLTPIGEYIPSFIPRSWGYSQRDPGDQSGPLTMLVIDSSGTRPYRIAPLICLEETLSKAAWDSKKAGAEIFVSPSNHGDTLENCALQQERMGQIRAIETATPLVRSGNIGESNVYDFIGKKIWSKKTKEPTMSTVEVPVLKNKLNQSLKVYPLLQILSLYLLGFIFVVGLMWNIASRRLTNNKF